MALAAVAEDEEEPMNQENADGLRANPPSARKELEQTQQREQLVRP